MRTTNRRHRFVVMGVFSSWARTMDLAQRTHFTPPEAGRATAAVEPFAPGAAIAIDGRRTSLQMTSRAPCSRRLMRARRCRSMVDTQGPNAPTRSTWTASTSVRSARAARPSPSIPPARTQSRASAGCFWDGSRMAGLRSTPASRSEATPYCLSTQVHRCVPLQSRDGRRKLGSDSRSSSSKITRVLRRSIDGLQ